MEPSMCVAEAMCLCLRLFFVLVPMSRPIALINMKAISNVMCRRERIAMDGPGPCKLMAEHSKKVGVPFYKRALSMVCL